MKKNSKKIIIILIIVILAGGFIGFNVINANRLEAAGGVDRSALPVHWIYPSRQTIVSRVSARGNVELRERTIVFPETQAQIVSVHVSVGDVVAVGDLLITYDDSVLDTLRDHLAEARLMLRQAELGLQATRIAPSNTEILAAENQIEQARTNIANIEAQVDQVDLQIRQMQDNILTAQNSMANIESLFNSGVATRLELDNAIDAVSRLEDQLALTQSQRDTAALGLPLAQESERLAAAQLDAIRTRNAQPAAVNQAQMQQVSIDQATLRISQIERDIADFEREERATVAGTVLAIHVTEGEFSAAGRPLMEIADVSSDNLVIVVHVPENDAANIVVGQNVGISGGALGGHIYDGYIQMIHPIAAPRQIGGNLETVLTVEIAVEGSERLRAGYTVDADIVTRISEHSLVVPLMSTLSAGGGVNFVFVIEDDTTLARRDIIIGDFSDMYVEVDGLGDEEMVIINPTPQMYPGMSVRPIQSNQVGAGQIVQVEQASQDEPTDQESDS